MKTSFLVILVASLTFALAGCGGGGSTPTTTTTTTPPAPTTTTAGNGTSTTTAGTDISGTAIAATLKSATFASDSSFVTAGVYHLSNPGPLKINYELASYVDKTYGEVIITAYLSNSQSVDRIWENASFDSQMLGNDVTISGGGAKDTISSFITSNSSASYMIESPAIHASLVDLTKPTYVLVTAYTQNTNIAPVINEQTVYISSQIAIPITIVP
jgi:predicted small lipoprotein YifL